MSPCPIAAVSSLSQYIQNVRATSRAPTERQRGGSYDKWGMKHALDCISQVHNLRNNTNYFRQDPKLGVVVLRAVSPLGALLTFRQRFV